MDAVTSTQSNPPTMSYRSVGEPVEVSGKDEEEERTHSRVARTTNKIFQVLTWAILAVVLLVWAVVGAIFWIPLLLRAMLRFSISLIEAMFVGQRPTQAAKILRDSVHFYRRGFVVAVEVVTREDVPDERKQPAVESRLLFEVFWAALVWYLVFLWMGWIQTSPLDLWHWFMSIPWREAFAEVLERFGL
jgi:hypothetical protein